jgi:preprotein translocase subunit SecB
MTSPDSTAQPEESSEKSPGLRIAQIFLESVEFSHCADALSLPPTTPAVVGDVNVEVTTDVTRDENAGFIRLAVSTDPASKPVYSVRLSMVAFVARQPGPEHMTVNEYLNRYGVVLLYPFLREAMASLTMRGRFGPVWLDPINPQVITRALQEGDGVETASSSTPAQPSSATERRQRKRKGER